MTFINTAGRRAPQPVPRTPAEIAALVPNAVCGHCWARHLLPCTLPPGIPPGSFHAARLTRLARSGIINPGDVARLLAACGNPGARPAAIITLPGGS